jgi:bacteriocin-like protein
MSTKNLTSGLVKRVNRFTIDGLEVNLVELSEKDLQHINGGVSPRSCPCGRTVLGCTDDSRFTLPGACSCQLSQGNEGLSLTALGEFDFISS